MSRRVVVTGMGAISPLGSSIRESWSTLLGSGSGLAPLTSLPNYTTDYAPLGASIPRGLRVAPITAASSNLNDIAKKLFSPQDERRMTPNIRHSLLTTQMALESAQLLTSCNSINQDIIDLGRISTTVGVGLPPVKELYDATVQTKINGKRLNPLFIPQILPNMVASSISIKFNTLGPTQSIAAACATGNNSIIDGFNHIRNGYADVAIVGAVDTSLHPLTVAGFHRLKSLSPEGQSTPFDANRDGFVIGEGAGTMVLEDLEHAQRRNAPIWAEMNSFGWTSDAYHITSPRSDSTGVSRALQMCLKNAGVKSTDIDYVNAHATSTPVGDQAELSAIMKTLVGSSNSRQTPLYVSSNKGAMGHLLGAAGLVESMFTILSLNEGLIPHTLHLQTPIVPNHTNGIHLVKNEPKVLPEIQYAICNSFGFGGVNTCILFKKW
ncbi:fatty acid synthase CEM1 KNAG_0L01500 [Huiozyma naganishii CBS 8797]|uniref:beta-ketoacyl-[acyl-carrier-protein] synthase I n=1 Tax=Huiozyma naganishii (strain ATCC MYA-139 / BCRC 22969 / CBS 8797 / KCTC 17520 / NBRC 10181 / NCYC 3082 / Yp74L-3) TaxID=1071383 RepID=J7RD08_HUIN7|nr:hypothetical protein KNAG_0L01500 [Kazachstania naganishii CBS 8797]CCK72770.1 hypothetical protein KNAG_0L01500 [Kazachstania naganishii CBS 8797]